MEQESEVLTVEEAAAKLRIGRGTAYEAIRRGELPAIRLCGRLIIPRAAFDRMLASAGEGVDTSGDGGGKLAGTTRPLLPKREGQIDAKE